MIGRGHAEVRDCPNRAKHTDAPDGYIAWHVWAGKKSRTHTQEQCPGCGYYMIWVRKNED